MAGTSQELDPPQDSGLRVTKVDQFRAGRLARAREKTLSAVQRSLWCVRRGVSAACLPMIQRLRRGEIIAFAVLILAVARFLYFPHAGPFFQGDTIFLLGHR